MHLEEFDTLIRGLLALDEWGAADVALNGLQVANSREEVRRVALAVDACQQSIRLAVDWEADLLFVHHGLYWGRPVALTGSHYRRVRALLDADLALYAVHLPLDMHPELGNNVGLARRVGLLDLQPFGEYKGVKIGFKGHLAETKSLEQVSRMCCGGEERTARVLPFGPEKINTVGIVSGGAAEEALQAIDEKLDLFITGEASHTVYHQCLESRINVIFGGHYLTETSGVMQLGEKLESETELKTRFFDIPTGL